MAEVMTLVGAVTRLWAGAVRIVLSSPDGAGRSGTLRDASGEAVRDGVTGRSKQSIVYLVAMHWHTGCAQPLMVSKYLI